MSFPLFDKLYGAPELLIPGVNPTTLVVQNLAHPWSRDLIHRYLINEGAGDTLFDLISLNHGSLVNGPTWITDPVRGQMMDFDGASHYASLSDVPLVGTSFSISAWVRGRTMNTNEGIVTRTAGSPAHHNWFLNIKNSSLGWQFGYYDSTGSTWREVRTTVGFVADELHWLMGTYDFVTKRSDIYVDGISRTNATFTSSTPNDEGTTKIALGVTEPFDGFIGDVRIYKRWVSPSEAWEMYNDPYQDIEAANPGVWIPEIAAVGGVTLLRRRNPLQTHLRM